MKIDLNDPKLTAFALNELPPAETPAIEKLVAQSSEAQALVEETRALAAQLRSAFQAELGRPESHPANVLPLPFGQLFRSEQRWSAIAIAAVAVAATIIAAIAVFNAPSPAPARLSKSENNDFEVDSEFYDEVAPPSGKTGSKGFVIANESAATFPLQVETGSYEKIRRLIDSGARPHREDVRVEELINSFSYHYPTPARDEAASVTVDAASCPWHSGHRLVRIGVRARAGADREEVLRNARIAVQFNPARVSAYRLLGYDNASSREDQEEKASSMRSGEQVTALCEIIPATPEKGNAPDQVLTVRLSHETSAGAQQMIERTFVDNGQAFASASPDFRFAAAVAEFGMILRDSPAKGTATLAEVLRVAQETRGDDPQGKRSAFVDCVHKAEALVL